jgi:hypothetical protein
VVEDVSKPAAKNTKAWAAREFIDRPTILRLNAKVAWNRVLHILRQGIADNTAVFRRIYDDLEIYSCI